MIANTTDEALTTQRTKQVADISKELKLGSNYNSYNSNTKDVTQQDSILQMGLKNNSKVQEYVTPVKQQVFIDTPTIPNRIVPLLDTQKISRNDGVSERNNDEDESSSWRYIKSLNSSISAD